MVNQFSFNLDQNYLSHHGILGQKWGKKNGPPYPLDSKTAERVKNKAKVTKRKTAERVKSKAKVTKRKTVHDFQQILQHQYLSDLFMQQMQHAVQISQENLERAMQQSMQQSIDQAMFMSFNY